MPPTFIYRFNRPTMPPFRLPPSINTSKHPSMKTYDFPREEERGKVSSKKTGTNFRLFDLVSSIRNVLVLRKLTLNLKHLTI